MADSTSNGTFGRVVIWLRSRNQPPENDYQHRPVARTQRFDDGSVLSTRHDGTTTARPYSPTVDDHFRSIGWRSRELESGETRLIGPSNVKIRGKVKPDGTFVASPGGTSAPEDQGGSGGGRPSGAQPAPTQGWDGLARGVTTSSGNQLDQALHQGDPIR